MAQYQCGPYTYVGTESLAVGDYSGSGTIGIANQRFIDELVAESEGTDRPITVQYVNVHAAAAAYIHRPEDPELSYHWPRDTDVADLGADVCIDNGAYGHRQYYIRIDEGAHPRIAELAGIDDGYPLLSDDIHSDVCTELEDDAWPEVVADLIRDLCHNQWSPGDPDWYPEGDSAVYGMEQWLTDALAAQALWDLGEWHDEEGGRNWYWFGRKAPIDTIRARMCDHAASDVNNPWPAIWLALTGSHSEETVTACQILNDWLLDHDLADVMVGESAIVARALWDNVVDAARWACGAESA